MQYRLILLRPQVALQALLYSKPASTPAKTIDSGALANVKALTKNHHFLLAEKPRSSTKLLLTRIFLISHHRALVSPSAVNRLRSRLLL